MSGPKRSCVGSASLHEGVFATGPIFELTQLVAVRLDVRLARRVVAGTALDQTGLVRMPEQNEGRPVVDGARVAGDLPSGLEQPPDGRLLARLGRNGSRGGRHQQDGEPNQQRAAVLR